MNYKLYQKSRNLSWEVIINENINSLPVSVTKLCDNMGIAVRYYNSPDDNDGYCHIANGQPFIFVNKNMPIPRQRFTAAHELGHILLGHVGKYKLVNREPSLNDNPIEQQANIFASRLLAPACVLWALHITTAEEIQELCNISCTSSKFRLERMNILYQREKDFIKKYNKSCFLMSPLERQVFEQFAEFINHHKN